MNISRYMTEELIKLEMTTEIGEPPENGSFSKWQISAKETVLKELVELLDSGARVGNPTKLLVDMVNREKQATTSIGFGIAVPHIRSNQAKDFMIGFARSEVGYEFDSIDNEPVRMFFVMAAPPYDDSLYLKVFKTLAEMLSFEELRTQLLEATQPGEIIRAIKAVE